MSYDANEKYDESSLCLKSPSTTEIKKQTSTKNVTWFVFVVWAQMNQVLQRGLAWLQIRHKKSAMTNSVS